ncbi:MAG TPA: tetratricopeptide repeat protein [Rhizomicrobium sp.]|nr:tetratricopeptide repeat protein [Rhizomicrobium sp.]
MDVKVHSEGCYRFGRFVANSATRELLCDGEPVTLSYRLFETLLVFVSNPGRILTKYELLEAIWPGRYIEESSLTQAIYTLRKLLEDGGDTQYIVTAPGRGYQFVVPVERFGAADTLPVPEIDTGKNEPARAPEATTSNPIPRKRRFGAAIAAAAVLACVAGALIVHWRSRAPEISTKAKNLVVADFQNLTNDPALGSVLGRVLQIELAQSPSLIFLSQQRVSETLQQMERQKDAPLTPALAQEVCARNQGDAAVSGTVARVGAQYIVTLEAKDCAQGATIIATKSTADREEDLPGALDGMILKTRRALSESAESIRRFDVPIMQATTSSFAALKAYSLGQQLRIHGDNDGAMQAYKHAIELDPSFAFAYQELANCYLAAREFETANRFFQKAFSLRAHATENQKLALTAMYYSRLGNWVEAARAFRLWTQTYPNNWAAWADLGNHLIAMARYDEAIAAGREALRLNPQHYRPYVILARAYKRANRFADAKTIGALAARKGLDSWDMHGLLYEIAYAEGDKPTMAAQVAKEKGKPTEPYMLEYEALAAATSGQLRRSEELFAQAIALARSQGSDSLEEVANFYNDEIEATDALASRAAAARIAGAATAAEKAEFEPLAFASFGDYGEAETRAKAAAARDPESTDDNDIRLPRTMAQIALAKNRPADAIAALQPALPYQVEEFTTPFLLGRAYLAAGKPEKAAAEFRLILTNRGVDANSPLYPLAYLGLARALHMEQKNAESRTAYQQLFAFWKDADSDLPVLVEAKAEYAKLEPAMSSLPRG